MCGMHLGLVPFMTQALTNPGYDAVFRPAFILHNMAEGGACIGVALRTKDAEKRAAVEPMRCTGLKDRPPRRRLSAHTFRRFGKQARRGKIFFHTRNYPAETGKVILWAVYFSGQAR